MVSLFCYLNHWIFGTILVDPLSTHVNRVSIELSNVDPTPDPVSGLQNNHILQIILTF